MDFSLKWAQNPYYTIRHILKMKGPQIGLNFFGTSRLDVISKADCLKNVNQTTYIKRWASQVKQFTFMDLQTRLRTPTKGNAHRVIKSLKEEGYLRKVGKLYIVITKGET